MCLSVRQEVSS